MRARLAELNKSNYNPHRGLQDPKACKQAENAYHGFYGPFIDV